MKKQQQIIEAGLRQQVISPHKGDGSMDLRWFFRAGGRFVHVRFFGAFEPAKAQENTFLYFPLMESTKDQWDEQKEPARSHQTAEI
ncbi:MAG: hypothetical protein M0Q41_10050 [Bacteroidales bacterium]|nr:hypothetical protein [Acholeplasmataceae bacterium]MCK9449301.1 hypothetical protein [Bacteroidales bacterium]